MTVDEYKNKLNKFISDIERVRDAHKVSQSLYAIGETDLSKRFEDMHYNKAKAYDFVIRKIKRIFNIFNDEKEKK